MVSKVVKFDFVFNIFNYILPFKNGIKQCVEFDPNVC